VRRADAISALLRGEPSCDGGGHRLARAVKDGKVSWRALNTSEPCGLRRPVDNSL